MIFWKTHTDIARRSRGEAILKKALFERGMKTGLCDKRYCGKVINSVEFYQKWTFLIGLSVQYIYLSFSIASIV